MKVVKAPTNKIPEILLDSNGYPTLEWLQFLKSYEPNEELPLLTIVRDVLPKGWSYH